MSSSDIFVTPSEERSSVHSSIFARIDQLRSTLSPNSSSSAPVHFRKNSCSSRSSSLPIIDVSALVCSSSTPEAKMVTSKKIGEACRDVGFFYIVNHGIEESLQRNLMNHAHEFFRLDLEDKMKISMKKNPLHWKGFFPLGDELTSGLPDMKEGIYFGEELSESHPKVQAKLCMHGPNKFSSDRMKQLVLEYMRQLTDLGHSLMEGIALSLNLEATYFRESFTSEPFTPFRIFHYPVTHGSDKRLWGVGKHTDYGVLTILSQDNVGGLEVCQRSRSIDIPDHWVQAPPIPGSFVVNIGDMLERWTRGFYKATEHRVRNTSNVSRISMPFFFDPSFDAHVTPLDLDEGTVNSDGTDERLVHRPRDTILYGDYITDKVSRCFPELFESAKASQQE